MKIRRLADRQMDRRTASQAAWGRDSCCRWLKTLLQCGMQISRRKKRKKIKVSHQEIIFIVRLAAIYEAQYDFTKRIKDEFLVARLICRDGRTSLCNISALSQKDYPMPVVAERDMFFTDVEHIMDWEEDAWMQRRLEEVCSLHGLKPGMYTVSRRP